MARLPILTSLRAFEAAARHQSFKKASDELHVTHTAISRQIQKLERELGRSLFERRHRQVLLTDEGRILFNAVGIGFSHIEHAVMQVGGSTIEPKRLVIAADPDFAGLWLVPRLGEFHATAPDTAIEIVADKNTIPLQNSRISCVIQYAPVTKAGPNSELLFRSHLFPVCTQRLLHEAKPLRSPSDLKHHVLLHDRTVTEWSRYLEISPTTRDVNFRSGIVFSENALCLDAAARGQGIAIGDDFLAANHFAEGRLVKLFGPGFLSDNAYYLSVPEDKPPHPTLDTFRVWLKDSIDRHRATLPVG